MRIVIKDKATGKEINTFQDIEDIVKFLRERDCLPPNYFSLNDKQHKELRNYLERKRLLLDLLGLIPFGKTEYQTLSMTIELETSDSTTQTAKPR